MFRGFGSRKPKQQRREKRHNIPFQRVSAEIQIEATSNVMESRVFLNDLSPSGVGCFVTDPIDKGEKVSIVIEQPKHLYVRGEVMWCSPYTFDTKVISPEQYKYRIGIKFIFDTPEESAEIKKYLEDLYSNKRNLK